MNSVKLIDKYVGDNYPCYTVAEIGGSFSNFEEAKNLINSALEIGLDAIKFQTLEADTITTKNNFFNLEATGNVSQYELFKHFELPKDLQKKIVNYANDKGIPIFSAPSHIKDLDIMKEMNLPIYKIGSDLACHIPLLKKIAKLQKPIILSTGMCSLEEVTNSVNAIKSEGNDQLILMHCVSNYPSHIDELNLNSIQTMKNKFEIPVGFSDHTVGTLATLTSAIMGANIIERHFKDSRNTPGPDDIHALTKDEFSNLLQSIHKIEIAKGSGVKTPTKSEEKIRLTNRVSIVSTKKILLGSVITPELIDIRRPGNGIQPIFWDKIIGKKTTVDIPDDVPITWNMIEN